MDEPRGGQTIRNRTGRYAVDKAGRVELAHRDEETSDEGAPKSEMPDGGTLDQRASDQETPEGGTSGQGASDEGEPAGGDVAEGAAPRPLAQPKVPYWLAQVPYFLVLSALAAGIVVVAAAYFKRGPAIIAGALLLAAAFRSVLPKDWIGMLAVRRRWIDLLTLVSLAVLLIVLAWVAPQLSS